MSSEQNYKEFQEFISSTNVKPPTGSIYDDLSLGGGPPMVRMICIQIAFQFFSKFKSVKNSTKALLIGLVCFAFAARDLNMFVSTRGPNIYRFIGADRNSDPLLIKERLMMAKNCSIQMDEESCSPFKFTQKRLNETQIQELQYVLIDKPKLRELYDKTETFIRKQTEKTSLNPSQGSRYLSAFTDLGSYSIFIIMMSLYVEKHQYFAKQMTIVSLLFFATITFQLRAPIEGGEESTVVKLVNQLPSLNQFTYFELSYIVKSIIYPMVFQAALFMSRMIDIDPIFEIRERLQEAQRVLSRSLVLCELMTDANGTSVSLIQDSPKHENDEKSEDQQLESVPQLDNQLDQQNVDLQQLEQKQQRELSKSLSQYGKADQHILRAYTWVCSMRKNDTIDYMRNRIQTSRDQEANTSAIKKIGRLLKKIIIIGAVGVLVGPSLYQSIAPQLGLPSLTDSPDQTGPQVPKTAQEIAKAAQEREVKEMERQRQKQKEFDDLYESGGQTNDL